MKKDWNPNDFQGRSKDQMERNYRIFAVGTGLVLFKLISYIF